MVQDLSDVRTTGSGIAGLVGARGLLARTSTVARLADVLRGRIADGHLAPGTRLGEHAVAQALGVSRNTLREAFRLLAHEGLVVHEQNRGVFVRTPGEADVRDIYATRRFVECAAVLGAGDAHASAIREIRAVVGTAHAAVAKGRWTDVGTADLRFHSAIVALVGSRRLDDMMRRLLAELRLVFHTLADPRRFHEPYVRRNAEIVGLIEHREFAGAAEALRTHLDDAERQLLTALAGRAG